VKEGKKNNFHPVVIGLRPRFKKQSGGSPIATRKERNIITISRI